MKLPMTLLALCLATAALAQPPQPPIPRPPTGERPPPAPQQPRDAERIPPFAAVDEDGDGTLSRREARGVPGLKFSEADADDSASLDEREYSTAIARAAREPRG